MIHDHRDELPVLFFQRQLVDADPRVGRGWRRVTLTFDPSVVPTFERLLRNTQELGGSRDIAVSNQFHRASQKSLGRVYPLGQSKNRRRTPTTAGRTPKLRDTHPQFDRAIGDRQIPHAVEMGDFFTSPQTPPQCEQTATGCRGTTVNRIVRSDGSTVADTTSNPGRFKAVVQTNSLDILVSAIVDSETSSHNRREANRTKTSCGNQYPVNKDGDKQQN